VCICFFSFTGAHFAIAPWAVELAGKYKGSELKKKKRIIISNSSNSNNSSNINKLIP
jgi:hypothetical protein